VAICTVCGAGSPEGTVRCASCGNLFNAVGPAVGEVVEEGGTPAGPGSWGRGVVHESRGDRLRIDPSWLAAPRALIAPTALLLALPLLLANTAQGIMLFSQKEFGDRYGAWLAAALTAFGAPFRSITSSHRSDMSMTSTVELQVVPLTVLLCWLLLLRLGLRRDLRTRLRGDTDPLTARQAGVEAARTALATALVTLLLGLVSGVDFRPDEGRELPSHALNTSLVSGIVIWQAVLLSALAAGLLAYTVYGAGALRSVAVRRPGVGGWLAAGRASGRATLMMLAAASVAALIVLLIGDGVADGWLYPVFLVNVGLFVLGIGSGARVEEPANALTDDSPEDGTSFSLFDLGDQSAHWWWAVALAVASAAALGLIAYRRRFGWADRLRLAAVHAAALTALTLAAGISISFTVASSGASSGGSAESAADQSRQAMVASIGWSVTTVLVASVLWAALGALAVPALLDAVRPLPALPAVEIPAQPVDPQVGGTVLEDDPAAAVQPPAPAADGGDPHAAFKRPADA